MKRIRKIPSTMVTQHPDHASVPFWHSEAFISAAHETEECFLSFSELGADEYKWDWEGKLVDEAVIDRLFTQYYDYFQKEKMGQDKFLTFRLPNPKVQTEFRLGRAFMGMISASSMAKLIGYSHNPLFEVILPMTETAEELISIQEAFHEMASLKHPLLKQDSSLSHIEVIPLFEQIDIIASTDTILEKYITLHKKKFKFTPSYLRPYLARSDPALNAGVIPTVLSIKIALSRFRKFEEKHGIKLYPIIGAASLPFRGGITPHHVRDFADEYKGVRTTTIQSGFKYDYPKEDVIQAIALLKELLPKRAAQLVVPEDEKVLRVVMKDFEKLYQEVIEEIAPTINLTAKFVPKRRERVQHVGLFGYSRGVGKVTLPRAIGFTAAMYSLGIPPELIGTGRGLRLAQKKGYLPIIEKYYKNIKKDLLRASSYLNKTNLEKLAATSSTWQKVQEDVTAVEEYLGQELGPQTDQEHEHHKFTTVIHILIDQNVSASEYIEQAALLRKSLG